MSTFQAGDICWDAVEGIGAVLVTSVGATTPLPHGRVLERYEGCSFWPGLAPDSIEEFAVIVQEQRSTR